MIIAPVVALQDLRCLYFTFSQSVLIRHISDIGEVHPITMSGVSGSQDSAQKPAMQPTEKQLQLQSGEHHSLYYTFNFCAN